MKTANPFVPTVSLLIVPQRNHRERVKTVVFCIVAAHVVFLLALLAQDFRTSRQTEGVSMAQTEDSAAAATSAIPCADRKVVPTAAAAAVAAPKPIVPTAAPASEPVAPRAQPAARPGSSSATGAADALYVVKSGDTLAQIARAQGTSVRALKAANGLSNERLLVGVRLKLPDSRMANATLARNL
jgi:cell envelope opacity-associated protein A